MRDPQKALFSLPPTQIYVSGKKVDEVVGADSESLQNMVIQAAEAHSKSSASEDDAGEILKRKLNASVKPAPTGECACG